MGRENVTHIYTILKIDCSSNSLGELNYRITVIPFLDSCMLLL